jgi:phosphate:Na+ symporter
MIGDFERISDHSVNLVESAEEIKDKDIHFSETAVKELSVLYGAVSEIMSITKDAFIENDLAKAHSVEPLEQVVDHLKDQIKRNHTKRLQKSECSIELGFILADILTDFERVADHCSNIALSVLESCNSNVQAHSYFNATQKNDVEYRKVLVFYADRFEIELSEEIL